MGASLAPDERRLGKGVCGIPTRGHSRDGMVATQKALFLSVCHANPPHFMPILLPSQKHRGEPGMIISVSGNDNVGRDYSVNTLVLDGIAYIELDQETNSQI